MELQFYSSEPNKDPASCHISLLMYIWKWSLAHIFSSIIQQDQCDLFKSRNSTSNTCRLVKTRPGHSNAYFSFKALFCQVCTSTQKIIQAIFSKQERQKMRCNVNTSLSYEGKWVGEKRSSLTQLRHVRVIRVQSYRWEESRRRGKTGKGQTSDKTAERIKINTHQADPKRIQCNRHLSL